MKGLNKNLIDFIRLKKLCECVCDDKIKFIATFRHV